MSAEDCFIREVRTAAVKLKNIPNTQLEDGVFQFSDYVAKNPYSWGYVPGDIPDDLTPEEYAENVADEDMYESYRMCFEEAPAINYDENRDGDHFTAHISVDIPEDPDNARELGEVVKAGLENRFA